MVIEQQDAPMTETEETPAYEAPVVEDIDATEGPAVTAALASA